MRRTPPAGHGGLVCRLARRRGGGEQVRTCRAEWAHCVRALGEEGGHGGGVRDAHVRACGGDTPRRAATCRLGVRAMDGAKSVLVGSAWRELTEGLAGASSANCARVECEEESHALGHALEPQCGRRQVQYRGGREREE